MMRGMEIFSGKIQKEEMSGRPGLKTPTGNLKRSYYVKGSGSGISFIAKLATRAIYAAIHEFGGVIKPKTKKYLMFKIGNRFIKTKSVTIPKRTNILKSFRKNGFKIINKEVKKAIVNAFRR